MAKRLLNYHCCSKWILSHNSYWWTRFRFACGMLWTCRVLRSGARSRWSSSKNCLSMLCLPKSTLAQLSKQRSSNRSSHTTTRKWCVTIGVSSSGWRTVTSTTGLLLLIRTLKTGSGKISWPTEKSAFSIVNKSLSLYSTKSKSKRAHSAIFHPIGDLRATASMNKTWSAKSHTSSSITLPITPSTTTLWSII